MKRVILFFAVLWLLICTACAESEITFAGIPWLTNDVTAIDLLEEAGLLRANVQVIDVQEATPTYLIKSDMGWVSPYHLLGVDEVTSCIDLSKVVRGRIAGFPIKNIKLSFAYDGDYKLIAVEVSLINAPYDSIKEKLKRVYGAGEEKKDEDEGIDVVLWHGEDESALLLYTLSDGYNYTLMYGRFDAESIIMNCMSVDPNDVSGL